MMVQYLDRKSAMSHRLGPDPDPRVIASDSEVLPTRRTALLHGGAVVLGVSSLVLPAASAAASDFGGAPLASSGTYPTPMGLIATPGDSVVTLSWSAVNVGSGSPQYQVQFRSGLDAWAILPLTTETTATITGLTNGTVYAFRVVATDGTTINVSSPSEEVSATPALVAPGTPDGLSVASGSAGALVATWSPGPGSAATAYDLRYSTDGSAWTTVTGLTQTTATITGLTDGQQYFVQVRASNTAGDSDWTTSVTGTPVASAETEIAAPQPVPPVIGAVTGPTSVLIATDKAEAGNGTLYYEYSTDGTTYFDAEVTVESPDFSVTGLTGTTTITVRKRDTAGGTIRGTSTVTLTARAATYSAGQVYTVTNASGAARLGTMQVTAIGGSGGVGGNDGSSLGGAPAQPGRVVATLSLAAGDVLTLAAGSGGAAGASNVSGGSGGLGGTNAFTGYAGGRGAGAGPYGTSGRGGGGGAASVVRVGETVTIVAGGGGGGGGAESRQAGAVGDGTTTGGFAGTTGEAGFVFTGSGDDAGGGGGGGGGQSGGSRGGQVRIGTFKYGAFNTSTGFIYASTPSRSGSNWSGGVAVETSDGFATGRSASTSGTILLEYLETTSITQVS
jgi:hypothetical protein